MRVRIYALTVAASGLILTSCTSLNPNTVVFPPKYDPKVSPYEEYSGSGIAEPLTGDPQITIKQMQRFEGEWRKKAIGLTDKAYYGDEVSFYSLVGAGISALSGWNPGAAVGASIAGGSNLWTARYALKIQAENYKAAARVMNCMSQAAAAVPESFWKNAYSGDQTNFPVEADGYKEISALPGILNSYTYSVIDKLQKAQSEVTLKTPSVDEITKALKSSQETARATESLAKKAAVVAVSGQFMPSGARSTPCPISEQALQKAFALPAKINECVASF